MYGIPMSSDRKLKLCALPTCVGKRYDLVHKFPMNNERAQQWIDIIDLPELKKLPIDKVRKRFFICSKHFRPQDYKNCESRSLNTTAYPRLFLTAEDDDATDHSLSNPNSITNSNTNANANANTDTNININTNSNEFHLNLQKCEEISTFEVAEVDNTTDVIEKAAIKTPIQYIICSSANDAPVLLRRSRNTQAEIAQENSIQIQTTSKPTIIKTCLNQDKNTVKVKTESSKFILKRNANHTIQPVRKKAKLGEPDTTKTYCNTSQHNQRVNQKDEPEEKTKMITLHHNVLESPLHVYSFWLRDHCRCTNCYGETFQRKVNIVDIPLDIEPKDIKTDDHFTHITWSDGHESIYNIVELKEQLSTNPAKSILDTCRWSAAEIVCNDYANVTLNDYLCNDDVAKNVIASLIKFGCAFIKNVPTNVQSTEIAVRRLFRIQKSHFGEMWSSSDNRNYNDTTCSNDASHAQTDNTYFADAAGLKILHCISRDGIGGENFLVDGFNVVNSLRQQNPEAYEYLCKANITYEYIEDGYHFKHYGPIINIDPMTNEPNQIRFNMNNRSSFHKMPQEESVQFYKHYKALATEIQREENEWRFILEPGTVCIFDNWRLLNGRTEYSGRRQTVGCYVARTEFHSVARRYGMIH